MQQATDRSGEREIEFNRGHDDRWRDAPFREDASDEWKQGWKDANIELCGDDSVEF